jgi:hypothetical protein
MSSTFLFVNKTAGSTSLSNSDGETTTAIFRHVQNHARDDNAPWAKLATNCIGLESQRNSTGDGSAESQLEPSTAESKSIESQSSSFPMLDDENVDFSTLFSHSPTGRNEIRSDSLSFLS